jgi:hypothetical protein
MLFSIGMNTLSMLLIVKTSDEKNLSMLLIVKTSDDKNLRIDDKLNQIESLQLC